VADEHLIESEVFVFGDVPQICLYAIFVMIKELRGGLDLAASLQHEGRGGAAGFWSGGGTYRNEGYVLVADWHGLTLEVTAVIECLYGGTRRYTEYLISDSGYQGNLRRG
jgi:hypothetical protein